MLYVITGGSGSGKSEYAEKLAMDIGTLPDTSLPMPLIYLATMMVWDEDGRKRVERHRAMRAHKGFLTVERYTDLECFSVENSPVLLLECMSNLVSNEYYRLGDGAAAAVIKGINSLQKECRHLIIVTNEVFSDGGEYGRETQGYIRILSEVNRYLGRIADSVTEVVYGIPVSVKSQDKNDRWF